VSAQNRRLRTRLAWSTALAVGAVVGATVMIPSYGGAGAGESKVLLKAYEQVTQTNGTEGDAGSEGGSDGHGHVHDPARKNDLSQSDEAGDTADPTTPQEAERAIQAVEQQRREPDPVLTKIPATPKRAAVPKSRYAMAGGCYAMKPVGQGWVVRTDNGYAATGKKRGAAEPFHFQAATLGKYLLFDSQEEFVNPGAPATSAADAGQSSIWKVTRKGGKKFGFASGGVLGADAENQLATGEGPGARFELHLTKGCATWPEITTNIGGRTFAGVSPFQEVRGTTDAHTHGMAFQFLSGGAHCGKPWSPFGVTVALVDCPDHSLTGGYGAVLETALGGEPGHDPVGWPTFQDWPAPHSLTHEGTYYKWMERAWQGGLRLFVNLLVENNQLCLLYPVKGERYSENPTCDDMKSVKMQAEYMHEFERYIDAQYGGPGKGWYRIVKNPFQARKVINQGKLAVVMGIETSIPFGCTFKLGQQEAAAGCDEEQIDEQLAEVHKMGVRQMELVNKFDNALSGIAGDEGATGVLVNSANFLETQTFWQMEKCPEGYAPGVEDKEQFATPEDGGAFEQRDGIFGAIAQLSGIKLPAIPLYGPAPHCNQRGLTSLGEHLIKRMADRGMIFDPDHMSVEARQSSLDLLEELDYSGVISSHSWSTPDAYPRIYELGGVVMPYAGDSTGFVDKWREHLTWADPRYYFGFGYGADINGLGAQGDPRGTDVDNPVTYPYKGWGGVKVKKQRSGERVYDLNADGVAHYGLYPDWLKDIELIAEKGKAGTGRKLTTDMQRGAEAYLQMWERALGVTNDACREPAVAKNRSLFNGLDAGMTVKQVILKAGQPHQRLDRTLTYCAKKAGGGLSRLQLKFSRGGRLL
jgi:hypothetical protein